MNLLLFSLMCFLTFLVFCIGCSPLKLNEPHTQSENFHSSDYIRVLAINARKKTKIALKNVQLLLKASTIQSVIKNSKADKFHSCDTLVQMVDALKCTTDNIALTVYS